MLDRSQVKARKACPHTHHIKSSMRSDSVSLDKISFPAVASTDLPRMSTTIDRHVDNKASS